MLAYLFRSRASRFKHSTLQASHHRIGFQFIWRRYPIHDAENRQAAIASPRFNFDRRRIERLGSPRLGFQEPEHLLELRLLIPLIHDFLPGANLRCLTRALRRTTQSPGRCCPGPPGRRRLRGRVSQTTSAIPAGRTRSTLGRRP